MNVEEKLGNISHFALKAFKGVDNSHILNDIRKTGEAVCKAIILKHYGSHKGNRIISGREKIDGTPTTGLPQDLMLHHLTEIVVSSNQSAVIINNKNERQKVSSYLEGIRVHGNAPSHDPNSSKDYGNLGDVNYSRTTLAKLLHWFYEFYLTDNVPADLRPYITAIVPCNTISDSYGKTRGYDIVKLCYLRQKVTEQSRYSDSKTKISYEYVTAEIAKNITIGYLFLGKNINIEASIRNFLDRLTFEPQNLHICTPRIISPETRKEVNRKKSIEDIIKSMGPKPLFDVTEIYFIDDFVWDNCLYDYANAIQVELEKERYFIDQELFLYDEQEKTDHQPSLKYIENILAAGEQLYPISVILGPGGVGKTTFCEQAVALINSQPKKKALFIPSTDFRQAKVDHEVKTVSDLVRVFIKITDFDALSSFEPNNIEINISCGNIVLIIDGLDEIESLLGDKFDRSSFLESAINLNEIYNNCSIIITSRDYHTLFYAQNPSINVFLLRGFSKELVDKYFSMRIPLQAREAKQLLVHLGISEQDRQMPLYISLVCDLIEREIESLSESFTEIEGLSDSKYFISEFPIDRLIYSVLLREIWKQSLSISCDEYFELLAEVEVKKDGNISKASLNEFIQIYFPSESASQTEEKFTKFYVSPLLFWETKGLFFKIKYDYLRNWIRARMFFYDYREKNLEGIRGLLVELSDGTTPLLVDFVNIAKDTDFNPIENAKYLLTKLIDEYKKNENDHQRLTIIRRQISGLLYFVLSGVQHNREAYTETLTILYGSKNIKFLSVYGRFFPIDFSDLEIRDGWFEQFISFDKCKFPQGLTVFFYCTFKDVEVESTGLLNASIFDKTCKLSDGLIHAVSESQDTVHKHVKQVKENLRKILKIGFRGNQFSWKSESVYRNAGLTGRIDFETFLRYLVSNGIIDKIQEEGGRKFGYIVSKEYRQAAKDLITSDISSIKIERIIKSILSGLYEIDS